MLLSSDESKYKLFTLMAKTKHGVGRKLVHAGGWQVAKRVAKMVPFGGTVIAVGLVGHDIRKKGLVKGVANSSIDAIPFVGLAKNAIELFAGDFIPDKDGSAKKKKK